jgi:type IV secretion system protein VirD4
LADSEDGMPYRPQREIGQRPQRLIGDLKDSPGARARVMAEALTPVEQGIESDPFWTIAAQNLLAGLIAHTIEDDTIPEEKKNLVYVAEIVAGDLVEFVLEKLVAREAALDEGQKPLMSKFTFMAFSNFINIGSADKARDSVIFTLNTYTENLLTDEISKTIERTSFNVDDIRQANHCYSFYIIIQPEKINFDSNVLRILITCFLRMIIARRRNAVQKELFILDECAQLGNLNELRQGVTLLRGYGVLAWMFFQDLSQLQTTYRDWQSIVNNCGTVQVFGYDRLQPAKEISRLIGGIDPGSIMRLGATRQILSIRGDY